MIVIGKPLTWKERSGEGLAMRARMTFREYLEQRKGDTVIYMNSMFGDEKEGEFLGFAYGFEKFNVFSGSSRYVNVYVPPTETGVHPSIDADQPYTWTGKVNEFAAEAAVWHAFEITADGEASAFMLKHRPEVIFEFVQYMEHLSVHVKYDGAEWILLND